MKPESTSIGASILAGGLAGASETVVTVSTNFIIDSNLPRKNREYVLWAITYYHSLDMA